MMLVMLHSMLYGGWALEEHGTGYSPAPPYLVLNASLLYGRLFRGCDNPIAFYSLEGASLKQRE